MASAPASRVTMKGIAASATAVDVSAPSPRQALAAGPRAATVAAALPADASAASWESEMTHTAPPPPLPARLDSMVTADATRSARVPAIAAPPPQFWAARRQVVDRRVIARDGRMRVHAHVSVLKYKASIN